MEDVHDDVRIIRHDPLAGGKAIHGHGGDAMIGLQAVPKFAGDGFQVGLGSPRANHEKIRETGDAAEVDRDDVFGFFFRGVVRAEAGELFRVDGVGPGRGGGRR